MSNKIVLTIYLANLALSFASLLGAHGDEATAWMIAVLGWTCASLCRVEIMLAEEEA